MKLCNNNNYYTTLPQVRYLLGGCFSVFIVDFEQVYTHSVKLLLVVFYLASQR